MNNARRKFLKVSALGALAAGGGAAAFAFSREPNRALQPWRDAGASGSTDARLQVLSWAVLAPNPHNLQPWLVRLDEQKAFTLFADPDRKLPETDPYDRQITIGLGCFLELARQAATSLGYRLDTTLFPDGEPARRLDSRAVARARLVREDLAPDPLFASAPLRRSCKEPYDMSRPVSTAAIDKLAREVPDDVTFAGTNDAAYSAVLREIGWRAHLIEMQTKRTLMESVHLMRIGKAEIEMNPDGIDIGGPAMELLQLAGVLSREQLGNPDSSAHAQGLAKYAEIFENSPAFVWLSTPSNSRIEQVRTGHAWMRVNLAATAQGLSVHPISQALQEYPEMHELFAQVHAHLQIRGGHRLQMLGRLGHGPRVAPSPRWPLHARMLS